MSFPRYPEYKDSGVAWLGEVPGHWDVAPLKRGYEVALGKMLQNDASSPEDELVPYLRAANIKWDGVDVSDVKQMWVSPREINQLALLAGDLLISEGGDVGRSAIWQNELEACYFQNSVNRARPKNGNSTRFLYYWISAIKDVGFIDIICNKSTIAHFTAEKVAAVPVPFPTPDEQQTIAAFLNRETEKIDALVAEQEKLIALLKEKRQAVISHAVTKGLNPAAPMKDSGIEWLGEVPEHWGVVPLGHLAALIQTGPFGSQLHSEEYVDGETPVINPSNIQDGKLVADWSCTVTQEIVDRLSQHKLMAGDIVFGRRGEMGRCAMVTENEVSWLCGTGSLNVRLSNRANPEFVSIYLRTEYVRELLKLESVGSTMDNLNTQILSSVSVPLPPFNEQQTIAAFLDRETAKLDALTAEAQRGIELLKERRSALISAAVTGKIDVRKAYQAEAA
ncbi:MAG: restriction endonuclease subunit S [Pseudomonadota bacterium]